MTPQAPTSASVLVVDDHPVLVAGLRAVIDADPHLHVVGTAGSIADAVGAAIARRPDIVLLDLKLPDGSGVDAIAPIIATRSMTRILVFSSFGESEAVAAALRAGAAGFILKTSSASTLVDALRTVAGGHPYLDPRLASTVIALVGQTPADPDDPMPDNIRSLTPQERKVLELIGSGLTNPEIAAQLYLSMSTVKTHVNRIFQKLGVRTRAQAVLIAVEAFALAPRSRERVRQPWG